MTAPLPTTEQVERWLTVLGSESWNKLHLLGTRLAHETDDQHAGLRLKRDTLEEIIAALPSLVERARKADEYFDDAEAADKQLDALREDRDRLTADLK